MSEIIDNLVDEYLEEIEEKKRGTKQYWYLLGKIDGSIQGRSRMFFENNAK